MERVGRLVAAGVDEVIVSIAGLDGPESLDAFAAVIAAVRQPSPSAFGSST